MGQTESSAAAAMGGDNFVERNKQLMLMSVAGERGSSSSAADYSSSSSSGNNSADLKTTAKRPPFIRNAAATYLHSISRPPLAYSASIEHAIEAVHRQLADIQTAVGTQQHVDLCAKLRAELRSQLAHLAGTADGDQHKYQLRQHEADDNGDGQPRQPPQLYDGHLSVQEAIDMWEQVLLAETFDTMMADGGGKMAARKGAGGQTKAADRAGRGRLTVQESIELWEESCNSLNNSSAQPMPFGGNSSSASVASLYGSWDVDLDNLLTGSSNRSGSSSSSSCNSSDNDEDSANSMRTEAADSASDYHQQRQHQNRHRRRAGPGHRRRISVQQSVDRWEEVLSEQPCAKMWSTTVTTPDQPAADDADAPPSAPLASPAAAAEAPSTNAAHNVHTDTPYVHWLTRPAARHAPENTASDSAAAQRTPVNTLLPTDVAPARGYHHRAGQHNVGAASPATALEKSSNSNSSPAVALQPRNLSATSSPFRTPTAHDSSADRMMTPQQHEHHTLCAAGCHKSNWTPRLGMAISPFAAAANGRTSTTTTTAQLTAAAHREADSWLQQPSASMMQKRF